MGKTKFKFQTSKLNFYTSERSHRSSKRSRDPKLIINFFFWVPKFSQAKKEIFRSWAAAQSQFSSTEKYFYFGALKMCKISGRLDFGGPSLRLIMGGAGEEQYGLPKNKIFHRNFWATRRKGAIFDGEEKFRTPYR